MLYKVQYLLLFWLIPFGYIFAQKPDFNFERITSKDGLAHNSVNSCVQDQEGYIWIGTGGGLQRFDGNQFIVFNPEKNNPASLSHSRVYTLFIDHENTLWIGTLGGGLNRYNYQEETFTRFMADKEDATSLSSNDIYAICEDGFNNLWVGAYGGGLNLYEKETGSFTHYDLSDGTETSQEAWKSIRAITLKGDNEILIGLDKGGLVVFDTRKKEVVKRYMNDSNDSSTISDNTINCFSQYKDKFLVGTWYGGLNVFNPNDESFTFYRNNANDNHSLSSNIIMATLVDSKGGIWAGTWDNGLNYMPPGEKKFYHYLNNPEDKASLSGNSVISIFEDRQGIIWFSTREGGLNKLRPYRNRFNHIYHLENNSNSLSYNNVCAFAEDYKGNVWIGTRGGGLNNFDMRTGKFTRYTNNPLDENSLPNNSILTLYADDEFLWIGTEGKGLVRMNIETRQFKEFGQYAGDRSNAVFDIDRDEEGNIWFSTWGDGVNKLVPETNEVINYPIDTVEINNNAVLSLLVEKDTVWIGSFGRGLVKLNRNTGTKIYYQNKPDDGNSASQWPVHFIFRAKNGSLWIGTGGGGLNLFNSNDGSFKSYTKDSGIINEIVNGIVEDNNNNLWLSTYGGMSKFDPAKERFINFDSKDGLQDDVFNIGTVLKTSSGITFFGGLNGANYFVPDNIKIEEYNPSVVLTGFKIFNKRITAASNKYRAAAANTSPEVHIGYKDRIISFEFTAFDYSAPAKIKYAYMLEGVDIDWVKTDVTRKEAAYSNLDPGEYNFYVKATNSYGEWNEKPLVVKVFVAPAYWQTLLFKVVVFVFIVALILLYIRYRERSYIEQQKQLEIKVAERTVELKRKNELIETQNAELEKSNATKNKFFQIIAHDLRNPIGGMYNLSDLLSTEYNKLKKDDVLTMLKTMRNSGEKTLELLNNLLNWSQAQTGNIEVMKGTFNLCEVIDETKESLKINAERKQITIEFLSERDIIVFADLNMIRTVVSNILSNAIKFTRANGLIKIKIDVLKDDVLVSIEDNGTGIPEKIKDDIFRIEKKVTMPGTEREGGTGLGLLLCKEFVELNNGKIWFESTWGKGTTFYFTIPKLPEKIAGTGRI